MTNEIHPGPFPNLPYRVRTQNTTSAAWGEPDGQAFCGRCEKVHTYCECDAFAYLLTHSAHPHPSDRPHPMGE